MKREELGSTGSARHCRTAHQACERGQIDRDGLGQRRRGRIRQPRRRKGPAFLSVGLPPDRPGDHLRALENISRQLRDDMFCRFLKQSKSPEDITQLLDEADNNQFGS